MASRNALADVSCANVAAGNRNPATTATARANTVRREEIISSPFTFAPSRKTGAHFSGTCASMRFGPLKHPQWAATREDTMRTILTSLVATVALAVSSALAVAQQAARADDVPRFEPQPFWPKPLPGNWILGQVSGIAIDKNDHIWIVHRPATLLDDEKGAQKSPPEYKCCTAAPAVMEFDAEGNLLRHWGGPDKGHPWVKNEHGIHVDKDGNVWVGGNNDGDQILKFSPDGKFLQQIGQNDDSKGSSSKTRLG